MMEVTEFEAAIARQDAARAEQVRQLNALDAGAEGWAARLRADLEEEARYLSRARKTAATVRDLVERAGVDHAQREAALTDARSRMDRVRAELVALRATNEAEWVKAQQALAQPVEAVKPQALEEMDRGEKDE
jgi:hypothetical protein